MLLEVVVFNFRSALEAAKAGADRLELCDNFYEGGTSPSFGMVSTLREKLSIPLFAMVRPRGGDFLYNPEEVEVMEKEIATFKELGCDGVVLGCLKKDGTIDSGVLTRLVELASPMNVTFHRAFDRVSDQLTAMEHIINCGCKRILTSGGKTFAADGADVIRDLISKAEQRIAIIPGGGINSENITKLIDTGAAEFHTPARRMVLSEMNYINKEMNENLECVSVDKNEIKKIKKSLEECNETS